MINNDLVLSSFIQPSLGKRVIVNGHDCHAALHFGVKLKKIKTKGHVVLVT